MASGEVHVNVAVIADCALSVGEAFTFTLKAHVLNPAKAAVNTARLQLRPVNAQVLSVFTASGEHVGNLKWIGGVWKFKAIGYDASGRVLPGGGPLTDKHNTLFAALDAFDLSHLPAGQAPGKL